MADTTTITIEGGLISDDQLKKITKPIEDLLKGIQRTAGKAGGIFGAGDAAPGRARGADGAGVGEEREPGFVQKSFVKAGISREGLISTMFEDSPLANLAGDLAAGGINWAKDKMRGDTEPPSVQPIGEEEQQQETTAVARQAELEEDVNGIRRVLEMEQDETGTWREKLSEVHQAEADRDEEQIKLLSEPGGSLAAEEAAMEKKQQDDKMMKLMKALAKGGGKGVEGKEDEGGEGMLSSLAHIAMSFPVIKAFFASIGGFFSAIAAFGKKWGLKLLKFTKAIPGLGLIVLAIEGIWLAIEGFMKGFEEGGIVGGILGALDNIIDGLIDGTLNLVKDLASWILGAFGFEEAEKWLDSWEFDISGGLKKVGTAFTDWLSELWEDLKAIPEKIMGWIKQQAGELLPDWLNPFSDDTAAAASSGPAAFDMSTQRGEVGFGATDASGKEHYPKNMSPEETEEWLEEKRWVDEKLRELVDNRESWIDNDRMIALEAREAAREAGRGGQVHKSATGGKEIGEAAGPSLKDYATGGRRGATKEQIEQAGTSYIDPESGLEFLDEEDFENIISDFLPDAEEKYAAGEKGWWGQAGEKVRKEPGGAPETMNERKRRLTDTIRAQAGYKVRGEVERVKQASPLADYAVEGGSYYDEESGLSFLDEEDFSAAEDAVELQQAGEQVRQAAGLKPGEAGKATGRFEKGQLQGIPTQTVLADALNIASNETEDTAKNPIIVNNIDNSVNNSGGDGGSAMNILQGGESTGTDSSLSWAQAGGW